MYLDNDDLKRNKGTICYVPEEYYSAYVEKFGNLNVTFDKLYKCGDAAYYTLDEDGLLTIRGTGSIYASAFRSKIGIKSVVVEDGITSIGNGTFYGCTMIKTITLPESVTSINIGAFCGCSTLKTINIPDSVTSIGDYTFYGCHALETITIPESVTSIGDHVFGNCKALKTVTLMEGVTSIGNYTFENCIALKTINIPESVTSIGDFTFSWCNNLETVNIPESVTSIGNNTFAWCNKLKTINIPESVTSIDTQAFYACTTLETITIPKDVVYIDYFAFWGCIALEKMYCYADPTKLTWNMGVVELKENKGTICYVPEEYYSAYVEKFGDSNITFNVMRISIEENAIYDSAIESIYLNAQIPGNSGVSFSLSEVIGDFTTEFDICNNDSNIGKLECTFHIVKAEPEVSVTLNKEKVTILDVITENDFTVESNVNGTIEWEGLGEELAEAEVSFAWTFTPDDTNYLPTSGIITVNVELPKIENIQYNASYDLSDYDFEHIRGISVEFSGQVDSTTNGCVVLGNHLLSTALNSNTVNDNTIDIEIEQYSLQSAPDTLTICDWHNTAETLGNIVSVTFYYMEEEEVKVADSSDLLYNSDNAIADHFDLSEYDYENIQSVTLVFDDIVYSGYGAIVTGENGGLPYNFCMNRSNGNFITIDVNGTLSDMLSFSNYYNLKDISYIVLNY